MLKDVIVLGSGSAGFYTALVCAKAGLSVSLVEKENILGGTGFSYGAVPVKLLIDTIKKNPTLSYKDVYIKCKNKFNKIQKRIYQDLQSEDIEILFGNGYLANNNTYKLDGKTIKIKNIIIATGSYTSVPEGIEIDRENIISHKEEIQMKSIPNSLIIIGADVEGIEFATIYSNFNTKIIMIDQKKEMLPGYDKDLKEPIKNNLEKKGVEFLLGEKAIKVEKYNKGVHVFLEEGKIISGEKCLIALGRKPSFPSGIDNIGLKYSETGIKVDHNFTTNLSNIYAVGDVNGMCLLGSSAINQGISIASKLITGKNPEYSYNELPRAVFADPQIAGAGLQEYELKEKSIPYKVGKYMLSNTWRGISKCYDRGFVKVIIADDGQILGIWFSGEDVSELVGTLGILIKEKIYADQLKSNLFVHPSLSEGILEALLNIDKGRKI